MASKIKKRVGERGVSYQVTVELPRDPITGKRRQKLITAPTKREVEALAHQWEHARATGVFGEADAQKLSVAAYLQRWLDFMKPSVRPSTHSRYSDLLTKHVLPFIGRKQLAKLNTLDLQTLYADRMMTGMSTTTVRLLHGIINKALKQAVRWSILTRNVAEAVDLPRRATVEYVTWTPSQVSAFLAVAEADDLAALWRLALLTGLRRGEILGLRWEDIDLKRKVLSVQRTLSRGGPSGALAFGEPKSAHGRRLVALPQSLVSALQRHRTQQLEARLAVGTLYNDQSLVFANTLGGPLHPNSVVARFEALTKAASLPRIRFHDMRHTSATLMLSNGEHPKIVQERLGHADVSMTLNRYSHVTMDMQRDAADRLDELLDEDQSKSDSGSERA